MKRFANKRLCVSMVTAATMLTLCSCAGLSPRPGPLTFGEGEDQAHTLVCVSDLGPDGSFYAGERLQNDTDDAVRIVSVRANEPKDLAVQPLRGRIMGSDDPHFLAIAREESSDPAFSRALSDLEPLEGMELPAGKSIGIVAEMSLNGAELGEIASLSVTYETGGETFSNLSAIAFQGSAGACPAA